jgi:hypothetical protein
MSQELSHDDNDAEIDAAIIELTNDLTAIFDSIVEMAILPRAQASGQKHPLALVVASAASAGTSLADKTDADGHRNSRQPALSGLSRLGARLKAATSSLSRVITCLEARPHPEEAALTVRALVNKLRPR